MGHLVYICFFIIVSLGVGTLIIVLQQLMLLLLASFLLERVEATVEMVSFLMSVIILN